MSNEKKMFASPPPSCLPELRRGAFARLFGRNIRSVREGKGLSIEQAACLSGMEVSEWAAIEEGYVPQDINRLRAMAGAWRSASTRSPCWSCSAGMRGSSNPGRRWRSVLITG